MSSCLDNDVAEAIFLRTCLQALLSLTWRLGARIFLWLFTAMSSFVLLNLVTAVIVQQEPRRVLESCGELPRAVNSKAGHGHVEG